MPDDQGPKRRTPARGIIPPLGSETSEAIRLIVRQQRDTQQTVTQSADRVDALRSELNGRIDQLDGKVDGLSIGSARVEGALEVLTEELRQDRVERSQIRVSAVQATIEIEKTDAIAEIADGNNKREAWRQLAIKALAVVGPILAALITLLITRC